MGPDGKQNIPVPAKNKNSTVQIVAYTALAEYGI
jgi:hypothetical protein